MLYPFSALLARMKYITRWSLMHSTRAESLSEHTCDTALLAHTLCLIARRYTGTPCRPKTVAVAALYHDAPEIIARVKDAVRVPVLGNGDIHSAEDAVEMMQATGCDGVMIARGALGDPWLFERVNAAIEGLPAPKAPNLQARMNALRRQVEEMVEQKGEFVAMPQARSQTMHYMKGLKGAAALRRYCCTLTHLEDLDELIDAVFEEQRKAGLDPDDVREVPFP